MEATKGIKPATPLPWKVEDAALYQNYSERIYATDPGPTMDFSVAFVRDVDEETRQKNAAYIVHACNNYPKLVEALRTTVNELDRRLMESREGGADGLLDSLQSLLRSLGESA